MAYFRVLRRGSEMFGNTMGVADIIAAILIEKDGHRPLNDLKPSLRPCVKSLYTVILVCWHFRNKEAVLVDRSFPGPHTSRHDIATALTA
jgi:hypothetical protein